MFSFGWTFPYIGSYSTHEGPPSRGIMIFNNNKPSKEDTKSRGTIQANFNVHFNYSKISLTNFSILLHILLRSRSSKKKP